MCMMMSLPQKTEFTAFFTRMQNTVVHHIVHEYGVEQIINSDKSHRQPLVNEKSSLVKRELTFS